MTFGQKIRMAMGYREIRQADVAHNLGIATQLFNQKLRTEKYSLEELEKIAAAMDAELIFGFRMKDGTII